MKSPMILTPNKCGLLPRNLSRIVAKSAGVASFAYQSRPAGTRPRFCTTILEFPVRISHSAPELPMDSSQPGSLRPFVRVSFAWLLRKKRKKMRAYLIFSYLIALSHCSNPSPPSSRAPPYLRVFTRWESGWALFWFRTARAWPLISL